MENHLGDGEYFPGGSGGAIGAACCVLNLHGVEDCGACCGEPNGLLHVLWMPGCELAAPMHGLGVWNMVAPTVLLEWPMLCCCILGRLGC